MKPAHTRSVVTQLPLMKQLSHTGQHVSKTVESARGDACAGEAVKMRALTTEPTDRGVVTIWPKKVLRRLTRVLAYIAYPAYGFIGRNADHSGPVRRYHWTSSSPRKRTPFTGRSSCRFEFRSSSCCPGAECRQRQV